MNLFKSSEIVLESQQIRTNHKIFADKLVSKTKEVKLPGIYKTV
jgi:hypothetical protein